MKDTENLEDSDSAMPSSSLGRSILNAIGAIALNIVWTLFIGSIIVGVVVTLSQVGFLNFWYFLTAVIITSLTIVMLVWAFINEVLPRGIDAVIEFKKSLNVLKVK